MWTFCGGGGGVVSEGFRVCLLHRDELLDARYLLDSRTQFWTGDTASRVWRSHGIDDQMAFATCDGNVCCPNNPRKGHFSFVGLTNTFLQ